MSDLRAATLVIHHHGADAALFARRELGSLTSDWRRRFVPIAYAVRGWQGGPHLELVVRDRRPERLELAEVAARLRATVTATAPTPIDPHEYRERARRLGALEGIQDPDLELREHGTVDVLDGAPPTALPAPLAHACERVLTALFAAAGTDPILGAGAPAGPARRIRVAAIMAELAASHPSGFAYGTISYRSHAEAFLATLPDPAAGRASLEGVLAKEHDDLLGVVQARLADRSAADLGVWREAFAYAWGCLDGAIDAGTLSAETLDAVGASRQAPPPGAPQPSAFHQAVAQAGIEDDPQPWFVVLRTLINCFYRMLPVLDVAARERYYLCLALAELVDEALEETWGERLDRAVQARRAAG